MQLWDQSPPLSAIGAPGPVLLSTLEVRWIIPGRRPAATSRWFDRFDPTTEEREDLYLIHPQQAAMSVKVRGSSLLELKLQKDDTRTLAVPGLARAGVKSCEKWSFPLAVTGGMVDADASWKQVRKARRMSRFSRTGQPAGADGTHGGRAACEAELTDIRVDGQDWWTVGLEAMGSGRPAWEAMNAAAASLFAGPLPVGLAPGPSDALAYSEWLAWRYPASG